MLLYILSDQASVTGFIDFLGIAESDQVVSGVLVGVLAKHSSKYYRVIRTAYPSTDPDGPIEGMTADRGSNIEKQKERRNITIA